jgi:hypothetical protein
MYKGRSIDPQCELSQADTFPCFDFLDNNSHPEFVDLVCSASHFVRMEVDLDVNGKPVLKVGGDSKLISDFIKAQGINYSKMPDKDKEMFENFVSFTNIKHPYGSAVSMRVLIEDFFKDNFLAPAINKYLPNSYWQKLFQEAKSENKNFLSLSLQKINFTDLLNTMKNGLKEDKSKNNKNKLKGALSGSLWKYISSDTKGSIRRLNQEESDNVLALFRTISSVIHGGRFDALQIFNESQIFFELLSKYFKEKKMDWVD